MTTSNHISVLLEEAIEGLNINPSGIYVDCTMGGAGHSSEILKRLNNNGHLYCFEQDSYAVKVGKEKLASIGNNYTIINANFVDIKTKLMQMSVQKVDGILYDLGVSSFQFDEGERGFSYNNDARLDMRMNRDQIKTAYDVVNNYSFEDLRDIFYKYGEEKFSSSIAKKIVRQREKMPITTTYELVEIIKSSMPASEKRKSGHPAKKIFQALRIEVNNELNVFEKSLKDALTILNQEGRIAVINFHSLEDRICKNIFRSVVETNLPRGLPIKESEIIREYELVNKKVIIPSENEISKNNRSHSAKLRIIKKI